MKRFPFKRQLIILVCIIAAFCIAIPVASFAKSATQDSPPKGGGTASNKVTAATDAPLKQFTVQTLTGGTKVVVNDGDVLLEGSSDSTVLNGFTVHTGDVAKTTWVVGDGQCSTVPTPLPCVNGRPTDVGPGDLAGFTGGKGSVTIGPDAFRGHDPCPWGPDTCLWDTLNADVTNNVAPGDISVTATVTSQSGGDGLFDCINHIAQVFSTGPKSAASSEGYVTAGVGLRNQGSGNITLTGIPAGAQVVQALLYRSILNPTDPGTAISMNGKPITSTLISSDQADPCWGAGKTWVFRSDVTTQVASAGGNGTYTLSGYPTGSTSGKNPWDNPTPVPMAEGASLVVIYQSPCLLNLKPSQPGPILTQLSCDPYTNSKSKHQTEVEPDTFSSGNTVVAAFQVGRFPDGGSTNIGWATSVDGGKNWTHGFLPGITKFTGGFYDRVTDPSVAYDAIHKMWLISSLAITERPIVGPVGTAVLVSLSTDGLNWQVPVAVANATGGTDFFDKNWIVCDNGSSKFRGHCYVQWDNHGILSTHLNTILMSTSKDGGKTWGKPLETADHAKGIGGQPLVQPKTGTVIVPYLGSELLVGDEIRAFTSTDGGKSWNKTVAVSPVSAHNPNGDIRTEPLPSAEIDGSGTVYVVWQDCRAESFLCPLNGPNDILLSTSPDGIKWTDPVAITPTHKGVDHFIPGLAVDKTTSGKTARLALFYYYYPKADCTVDTCQLDVGFTSSTDSGKHWSTPSQLAGPMKLTWLPKTTEFFGLVGKGYMVGDYISASFVANGDVVPVFAVATAPSGGHLNEAMFTA